MRIPELGVGYSWVLVQVFLHQAVASPNGLLSHLHLKTGAKLLSALRFHDFKC